MTTTFQSIPAQEHRRNLLKAFVRNESGATAIEYGLIASLIIIGIIGAVNAFSQNTSAMYTNIADTLDGN